MSLRKKTNQRKRKLRGNFSEDIKEAPNEYNILLKNVSIYDLAKAFNLTVIGEGVETPAQLDAIRSMGCDCAQGFLFKDQANIVNPHSSGRDIKPKRF